MTAQDALTYEAIGLRAELADQKRRLNDRIIRLEEAVRLRCQEDGHRWVNCCSIFFQIYQTCKWCGETR